MIFEAKWSYVTNLRNNKTRNTADWEKYIELKKNVNVEKKRKKRDYFANYKIRENNGGDLEGSWRSFGS